MSTMAAVRFTDEEIIKRKLMFDGEGTGDDRRFNVLMKQFCIWSNQLDREDVSAEDKNVNFERMMVIINDAEMAMNKSEAVKQMCAAEMREYDQIFGRIEGEIDGSKQELLNLKEQLIEAKAERKNKSEANAVCAQIEEYPSRDETNRKLFQVNDEIGTLERATVTLRQRLENWKKRFEAVIASVQDLNALLEGDVDGDIIETDKQDVDIDIKPEVEPMDVTVGAALVPKTEPSSPAAPE